MPAPGDIGFAHSNGVMGRAIRLGERIRWGESPSYWNHAFIVGDVKIVGSVDEGYRTETTVIQAEPSGVTDNKPISSVGSYTLLEPHPKVSRADILAFARAQVGEPYGFGSIASVMLDIVTPNWFPAFRRPNTWICSALVAESLRHAGWLHNWKDIYTVTPAQLYAALTEMG